MNFIKGIFNKVTGGGGTTQPAVDQEIFDFFILGTIYKQDEDKFSKLSSNTEIVFDKLSNDPFDHILIVRLHKASKQYNNTLLQRQGDFYFNISFFKQITQASLSDEIEEFSINLLDSTFVDWSIRLHFYKTAKSDYGKLKKFKLCLCKLIWIWQNKKAYPPKNEAELFKLIPVKPSQQLEMKQLVQQQQTKKVLKKVDRSILKHQISRNRQDKETIGDILNYFLQHDTDTIKQIYVGQLFVLYPETAEILQINPIVVMALNILSKTECRMELYNKDRQLLLIQSLKDFISFEVDQTNNYLSWVYFDGYNSIVLYLKFDVIDGATSMAMILQRARVKMQTKQELQLDDSISSLSTQTTIAVQQVQQKKEKQMKAYLFNDQVTTIAEFNDKANRNFILLSNQEEKIILRGSTVYYYSKNYLKNQISIDNQIQFDKCCLQQDNLALYTRQDLYIVGLKNQSKQKINVNQPVLDVLSIQNQFTVLTPSQVYTIDQNMNLNLIYTYKEKNDYIDLFCGNQNNIIIGTTNGQTLIFDAKSMKLLNKFDGLGDRILDIAVGDEFLIINNGSYLQYQQVITDHSDGFREKLDLVPFPVRIALNPEDLILLGIFSEPNFKFMRVDSTGSLIIAELEQMQIVWNLAQLHQTHSYQIFLLTDEICDQNFSGQNMVLLTENRLQERLQK